MSRSRFREVASRLCRELGYLLPLGPIAAVACVLLASLALVSAATLVIWIGIPLGVATLWLARAFASVERARLRAVSREPIQAAYAARSEGTRTRRFLAPALDAQSWRDLAHGVLTAPLALVTWLVAMTWTAVAVGGTTAVAWMPLLPPDDSTETGFLGWLGSVQGVTAMGLIALATLPLITRPLAAIHAGLGRWLLAGRAASVRSRLAQVETARRAAASAEAESLRRIERNLHDGPQQQLVRLGIEIDRAARAVDDRPEEALASLATAKELAAQTLAELRALSRGIAPPLLADRGLGPAVGSLADRATIPVSVSVDVPHDLGLVPQTAAYFVIAESLANVAKHAEATQASVTVSVADGMLTASVADDGRGGAHVAKGHGLAGLVERVAGNGGTLSIADAPGGGTVVIAEFPCA